MFKRANKITALLVAAASVMSIVPAMAADNTRLGYKSGTVKQGIAFEDGKYGYYGFRTDDDETGIWYNKGGDEKDAFNDDLEDYRFNNDSKYGEKYAYAKENSNDDEYLVDLSTGKIVDDETAEEKQDAAQAKLSTQLKKADRYKGVVTKTSDLDGRMEQILRGQFGEVWYQYNTNIAATNGVGSVLGEVQVTANTAATTLQIGDKTFDQNASTPVAGYTTAADFAAKAGTKTYTDYDVTAVDSTTGKITLTQKVAANLTQANADALAGNINVALKVVTPGTALVPAGVQNDGTANVYKFTSTADFSATSGGAVLTDAPEVVGYTGVLSGTTITYTEEADANDMFTGKTFNAPTLYDTTVATPALTAAPTLGGVGVPETTGTAAVKAVVEVTPVDLTKDVKILGSTIYKNANSEAGFVDAAGFKAQLDAASANKELGNYVVKAGSVTTTGAKVSFTLVQIKAEDLNQGDIDFDSADVIAIVTKNGVGGTSSNGSTGFTGFTNESGKYIDASYTANMKVYSTSKGRAVMIDEYGVDGRDDDAEIQVDLDSLDAIAQDKDYIYAIAKVTVRGAGVAAGTQNQVFLQKISKAQGSKDADEAYVPKSVNSYQIGTNVDAERIYDNGDMTDAYKALMGTLDSDYEYLIGIEAVDGKLYVTRAKEDGVKVYELTMKSVKSNVVVDGANLKKDVDTYALVKTDDGDTDIVKHSEEVAAEDEGLQGIEVVTDRSTGDAIQLFGMDVIRHPGVSIDVEGNTWALDKGQIKKFTKTDAKNIHTCDRAMDAIDAYNDSSVIAWDTDGDAYTTLQEGTKVTEGEATAVAPVIVTGWVQDGANWSFNDTTGAKVTSKWINVGGNWYFLKADGVMATGWYNDNGTWYFLKASGAMATGWIQDGANWYYLNGSGAMLANTTVDGYVLGASGAWVK